MKPRAVITHWVHPEVINTLSAVCEVVPNESRETLPREEIIKRCKDAEAVMIFLPDTVDKEFLDACPKLKIVSSTLKSAKNADIDACTARGAWLTLVPDMRTIPAAELTIGLLIGIARRMPEGDRFVREGKFSGWRPDLYGVGLAGNTAGIAGMGAVGQAVAKRLIGFEMKILYCDPVPLSRDKESAYRLTRVSFEELIGQSHFVIISVPLSDETRHFINGAAIAKMKKGSYIINTSNGAVVDETAITEALESGHLAGYAADVFEMENSEHQRNIPKQLLGNLQGTFFTPHIGSAVDDIRKAIAIDAAQNILQMYNAQRPKGAVNQPPSSYGLSSEQYF